MAIFHTAEFLPTCLVKGVNPSILNEVRPHLLQVLKHVARLPVIKLDEFFCQIRRGMKNF